MSLTVGEIRFGNHRVNMALDIIHDEALNAFMWEQEFHKKDYECEELKKENERLSKLVEELLCKKSIKKSKR